MYCFCRRIYLNGREDPAVLVELYWLNGLTAFRRIVRPAALHLAVRGYGS